MQKGLTSPQKRFTEEQEDEIRRKYWDDDGLSFRGLGVILGCSYKVIQRSIANSHKRSTERFYAKAKKAKQ